MTRIKAVAARAAFVVVLGINATTARAEFFEFSSRVTISNVTSPIPNSVVNGAPGPLGANTASVTDTTVGDAFHFQGRDRTARPDGASHLDAGFPPGTDIALMTMTLSNLSATVTSTFAFDYALTLTVTDYNARIANSVTNPAIGSGTLVVAGHVIGSYNAIQQNTTVFTMVPQAPGALFTAGDSIYQLFSLSFIPPSDVGMGGITAHLNSTVPEPASMSLLGIGALGMCRRIRRRDKNAVNA